jgi:choline transport protein
MAGRVGCTSALPQISHICLLTSRQWQALVATVSYTAAGVLLSMVTIYKPSYQQQNWQQSLVMVAIGMFATLMNTYGAKKLPMLEYIMLVVQLVGFICIITALWALPSPKAPASEVFTSFSNFGGWPNIGTACFVGSITATASFAGSDAAAHMAEEVEDASRAVPRMIMLTIAVNGLMAFVFIITYVSIQSTRTIRLKLT